MSSHESMGNAMNFSTDCVFHKNQNRIRSANELCYEYISTTNPQWARYCVFDIVRKTVIMERCEGRWFDGHEGIHLHAATIDYIVSIAPEWVTLSRNLQGWE